MTNKDYKRQAHNYYRENELYKAYSAAWNLPFSDFVKWFTDMSNKRRKRIPAIFYDPFFYNSFLVTKPIQWLNQDYALILWKYYLSSQNKISLDFELYVAKNNPSLFIKGYKQKRSFLDRGRLSLIEEHDFPKEIKDELKIWVKLCSELEKSKKTIDNLFKEVGLASYDLLMSVIASFEAYVFCFHKDEMRWYYAGETLSLLVSIIQNQYNLSSVKVDKESLIRSYHKSIQLQETHTLFDEAFSHILLTDRINRYSFEPNLIIHLNEDNRLEFQESKAFNKQWERDEPRYAINEQLYYRFGDMLFDELKNNNSIKFINGNTEKSNQLGNSRQLGIKQAVYDLGIRDEDLKNNNLPSLYVIISFLHGLAWRKLETTQKNLFNNSYDQTTDYSKRVEELILKREALELVLITSRDDLYKATFSTGLKCESKGFHNLVNLFSYKGKNNPLDSLNQKTSLWQKPFIKVGENTISPIGIITSFTSLYTISESILRNFSPREGRRIEEVLEEVYSNESWETYKRVDIQECGDIDIVMEDDCTMVLLQLKRTTQKVNMVELNNQYFQDLKAIEQLIEARKCLKNKKKIHLWYVTTAFEKVYTKEKGVLRISYQDLLHIKNMLDEGNSRFNSLKHFVEFVESDKLYITNDS